MAAWAQQEKEKVDPETNVFRAGPDVHEWDVNTAGAPKCWAKYSRDLTL